MTKPPQAETKNTNLWAVAGMTLCFVAASVMLISGLAHQSHAPIAADNAHAVVAVHR